MVITTASQYMVAAISVERYIAICHQCLMPPKHMRTLFWVIAFSLLVNIPRFCEFISHHVPTANSDQPALIDIDNNEDDDMFSLSYHTSRLGENPEWLLFASCHEIAVIILSLAIICFCNLKVWLKAGTSAKSKLQR